MSDLVEIWEQPAAAKFMIAGWQQWADAGDVSSGLPEYLIEHTDARHIGQLAPNGWRIRVEPDRAEYHEPDQYSDIFEKPFAEWFIFERTEEYDESHNPYRFSLLFICADGAAAYQALYLENRMTPKILAIIQPGEAFGCNWTNFTNRGQILARSVFHGGNPLPEYLINGGIGRSEFYRAPIWPEYTEFVKKFNIGAKYFRIWARSDRRGIGN